jgi:hypothetical protein
MEPLMVRVDLGNSLIKDALRIGNGALMAT